MGSKKKKRFDIGKLADHAKGMYDDGEYRECVQQIEEILRLRPNDLGALHNLQIARFMESRNVSELVEGLKRLVEKKDSICSDEFDDERIVFHRNLGMALRLSGDLQGSIHVLNGIVELAPDSLLASICIPLIENHLNVGNVETCRILLEFLSSQHRKPLKDALILQTQTELLSDETERAGKTLRQLEETKENSENASLAFTKAQLYYVKGDSETALGLLNEFQEKQRVGSVFYYNNLSAIHMLKKQFGLAGLYICLGFDSLNRSSSQESLYGIQACQFMYNSAIQCMGSEEYERAIVCFEQACRGMHGKALIWLRMAECCIKYYKLQNDLLEQRNLNSMVESIKRTKHITQYKLRRKPHFEMDESSPLSFDYAQMYLSNCKRLAKGQILECALLNLSFIQLYENNPTQAYENAASVLNMSENVNYQKTAKMYMTQALSQMGEPEQALKQLPEDSENYVTNQAALEILCGNLEHARELLSHELEMNQGNPLALRLRLLLAIQTGSNTEAESLLECRRLPT